MMHARAVAVGARPLERHKDLAGLHLPGVIGHPGDDEIFVTLEAAAFQTGQKALQRYGGRLVAVHDTLAQQLDEHVAPAPSPALLSTGAAVLHFNFEPTGGKCKLLL